jgi:site-specific recombinase XerD
MGAEEVRTYLLHLTEEKKLSPTTINQIVCAIRFFYINVLDRPCEIGKVVYQKRKRKLPEALSEQDVVRLVEAAANLWERAILMTLYAGGLRLLELIQLAPKDIDSQTMRIRIRAGKGGKERYVVLSETLLEELRHYFRKFRPERWLFYADKPDRPIHPRTIQRMVREVARRAGLNKKVTPHVLRHSFATHLLDHGTNLRYIQELMGHKSLKTTMLYTHVSRHSLGQVVSPPDRLSLKTKS